MRAAGSHTHSIGINFFGAILSGGNGAAFVGPNNSGLGSANAAGNATIPLAWLDTSDVANFGSTGHDLLVNTTHVRSRASAAPTITSGCGTSGQSITSNSTDFAGSITLGSAGLTNTCTVAWAASYTSVPFCVFSDDKAMSTAIAVTPSTSGFVIGNGSSATAGSHVIAWVCVAPLGG